MPKSLKQIQEQIDKLEKQAEVLRVKEVADVIGRIKEAILHYGLTEKELFGAQAKSAPGKVKRTKVKAADKKPKKAPSPPKYRDEAGNNWTGVGKRPNWYKAALEAGKSAEELLIKE